MSFNGKSRKRKLEFIFQSTGIFTATVHASNAFGILEKNITIIAMDQHIRNVSAQLEEPKGSFLPTDTILLFHLEAFTADRRFTFIEVDFDDGVVKTAAVREKQEKNHSMANPPNVTLFASYGVDGCTISLKFDHVYEEEGVFSPLITLFNNVSSVTTRLQKPLILLHEIRTLDINSSAWAPQGVPILFSVELKPISENVTVEWFVSDRNGNSYTNKSSKDLEIFLTFANIGSYKIQSTVSNALSSQSAFTRIIIQQNVKGLHFSCIPALYLKVGDELSCNASVEEGSDVSFKWDFMDESGTTDVIKLGDKHSAANHTYLSQGVYSVHVEARNGLDILSQVLNFVVYGGPSDHDETAVSCLNVVSTAPALPGMPVVITATATRGTNLIFDTEIEREQQNSGQKHQRKTIQLYRETKMSNGTTTFVEGLIFPRPAGFHKVTVHAKNNISNTFRTLGIHIREPPLAFHVKVISTPYDPSFSLILQTSKGKWDKIAMLLVQSNLW
ncbi:hypothetical protein PoB_000893000 [Plakobranchus ocellatus]|uniref:PKD domain-containing protein n=1 Tax=Plakobranchus ocellatus TaxID=259542 RepID=A0AAV3YI48_9GAST|nr:hypothetical protein PoB_000893000 [Plakobranchus ocellatus]